MKPSAVLGRLLRELKLCNRDAEHSVLTNLIHLTRDLMADKARLEHKVESLKREIEDAKPTTDE